MVIIGYAFLVQELVPKNVLPDDFILSVKHSDYSSVSYLNNFLLFYYTILSIW